MVASTCVIRQIEDSDRVDHERQNKSTEARGDYAEAHVHTGLKHCSSHLPMISSDERRVQ